MAECKQCGEYMNSVQVIISSNNGVCGNCCRKNHKLVILGKDIPKK